MVLYKLPDWTQWVADGVFLLSVGAWLIGAAISYKTRTRRRWIPGALFVCGYVAAVGGAILNDNLGDIFESFREGLRHPGPPFHLDESWGKTFTPTERAKHSEMLARHSYQSWGIHVKHFDESGRMKVYEPTTTDQIVLRRRRELVVETQTTILVLRALTALSLLLPLIGIGTGVLWPTKTNVQQVLAADRQRRAPPPVAVG